MRGGTSAVGPTSIEQALERLEQAHESLLGGIGNLSTDLFHTFASTLRDGAEDAAGGSSGVPATGTGAAHHGTTPWGVKASQGSRPNMEDAYSVQVPSTAAGVALLQQHHGHPHNAPAGAPVDLAQPRASAASSAAAAAEGPPSASALFVGGAGCPPHAPASPSTATPDPPTQQPAAPEAAAQLAPVPQPICAPPIPEDLAVLSVFDGHGGTEVAEHCRDRLHMHFAAALSHQRSQQGPAGGEGPGEGASPSASLLERFSAGSSSASSHAPSHVSEALRMAFNKIDQELAGTEAGEYVGATAVVAVVGRHHIWIAHCGEWRDARGSCPALAHPRNPPGRARLRGAGEE